MGLLRMAIKAKAAWRDAGLIGLRHGWSNVTRRVRDERAYRRWMKTHELTDIRRKDMRDEIASFNTKPLISVILPVYNVDEKWLRRCIDSVLDQIYPNWELCIADDASPSQHVRTVLGEYAAKDERVKVVFREQNGHISAASNSALELASGTFVVLLDHDDELSADALFRVAREINEFPETAVIYSDEDLIDEKGTRFAPKFKPDFSRDLFYSLNLLTHLSAYRTDILRSIGGFRIGFEGSQDYDLALRVLERTDESQIRHIPRVLYHWRVIRGSVAFSMDEKPYAHERARQAIREHFERTGVKGDVVESFHNLHRVSYRGDDRSTASFIVTASGDEKVDPASLGIGGDSEVIAVRGSSGTRAELLNDAASGSNADVLIFVDGDVKFSDENSIEDLVGFAMHRDVGAVGGRIIARDMFVEEAGVVLGPDLSPAGAHRGYPREAAGHIYRNRQIGNYSAIPIACLAIRREAFEAVGGFDAGRFPDGLFDIDLCLRLRELNKRIVMLPHVELLRSGRPHDPGYSPTELAELRKRWPAYAEKDPFCSPNLKRDGSFEIGS